MCDEPASHSLDNEYYCNDCAFEMNDWAARMRQSHTLSSIEIVTIRRLQSEAPQLFPYAEELDYSLPNTPQFIDHNPMVAALPPRKKRR